MLSTSEVMGLVEKCGLPGGHGRAHLARRLNKAPMNSTSLSPNQKRFVDTVISSAPPAGGGAVSYRNPMVASASARHTRRTEPLTQAQVVWLSRLPSDPAQIPYDDVVEVFRLLQSVPEGVHSSDLPLLRSIATPLQFHHERKQAEADLAHTRLPLPQIPGDALPALADAIADETPSLRPQEALQRASEMLHEFSQQRTNAQASKQHEAQQRIAAVDAAVHDRGRTSRLDSRSGPGATTEHMSSDSGQEWARYRASFGDTDSEAVLVSGGDSAA